MSSPNLRKARWLKPVLIASFELQGSGSMDGRPMVVVQFGDDSKRYRPVALDLDDAEKLVRCVDLAVKSARTKIQEIDASMPGE